MSQEKEYITINDECGQISIAQDVIASIAAMACREVEGISSLTSAEGGGKGIVVTRGEDDACTIDVHAMVKMDTEVAVVAEEAQRAIKNAIESTAGLTITGVNVYVAGIAAK